MPRRCTICSHEQSAAIDAAVVEGTSYRHIAARFKISTSSLSRHVRQHLIKTLAAARKAEQAAKGDDLLRQVEVLRNKAYSLLLQAEKAGKFNTALRGVREARGCLELLAKLLGELDERPTVNVLLMPEWARIKNVLLDALVSFPEARAAACQALLELDGDGRGP